MKNPEPNYKLFRSRQKLIGQWMLILLALFLGACASNTTPASEAVSSPEVDSTAAVADTPGPTVASTPSPLPASPLPTPTSLPTPTVMSQLTSPITPTIQASTTQTNATGAIPVYTYKIINSYPHDPNAYTQGLIYVDGILYEGTGRRGASTLRRVELETGQVVQRLQLPPLLFGEGITLFDDRIIQLTWQSHLGFVYDRESFELLQTFTYPTEGWGLTHDGKRIIMSDGTANLYFRDPETLEEIGRIEVDDANGPVTLLNELEYINDEVYANIYRTDRIAIINPDTGQVRAYIDLTGLLGPEDRTQPVDVLNGIAYDADHDRLFVTGKWWPKLFEIELVLVEK
jgi:glutamine cyclotransferase